MLYSLVPPILIVLSLIGIIIFLAKKSSKLKNMPIEEPLLDSEVPKKGFFKRFISKFKWDNWKSFFLSFLEKITRKSRMIFLKLEAKFEEWSTKIRNKRKARSQAKVAEVKRENSIIEKLREYKPERKMFSKKINEIPVIKKEAEEKPVKPMISERIITPRSRAEIKDKLEELLIERIAVNSKDVEAYERLGEYYMEIKSYEFAKECFKQVMKLDPLNRNVKYKMRRLEYLLSK